jgi:hypothetical protein
MTTEEAGTARALASSLCAWLDRLFPDVDRGDRLKRALDERFRDDVRVVTREVCDEIEEVAPHSSASARSPRARRSPTTSRARDERGWSGIAHRGPPIT